MINVDLEYYYIVLGKNSDYYVYSYSDVERVGVGNYIYEDMKGRNNLLRQLYHFHLSKKINKLIDIPCKSTWNRYLLPKGFTKPQKPICFLFFAGENYFFRSINYGFADYLRDTYPGSKLVAYYQDLVSPRHAVDMNTVKSNFDLVLSFDQGDCSKYDLIYQPLVYSCEEADDNSVPENDVYFVGHAKDRLAQILETYVFLRDSGLKCDFHIIGTSTDQRPFSNEIDYCDFVPYLDNIRNIKKSKAILEIMQGGGKGFTLRYCEAIAFDRMLVSNNSELQNASFFKNNENVIQFRKPDEININRIKLATPPFNYHYKENLSPIVMFKRIEQTFSERL